MGEWEIRRLTEDDCAELGQVHVAVWREAYAGLMPATFLDRMDPVRAGQRWEATFAESPARTWVARDGDGLVGFVSAGPSRDEAPPTTIELWALNLLARAHGSGLGDELITTALGDEPASLWVLEANARAVAFYARHGFVADGASEVHEPSGQREIRMVRAAG